MRCRDMADFLKVTAQTMESRATTSAAVAVSRASSVSDSSTASSQSLKSLPRNARARNIATKRDPLRVQIAVIFADQNSHNTAHKLVS